MFFKKIARHQIELELGLFVLYFFPPSLISSNVLGFKYVNYYIEYNKQFIAIDFLLMSLSLIDSRA